MVFPIKVKRVEKSNDYFINPIFDFQDKNQEQVIHSGWKKGNSYRFVLEGTGDIFREFAKNPKNPDKTYVNEKIRRIKNHFELMEKQKEYFPETQIHPEDSIQYARENNPEKFVLMKSYWVKQPVKTKEQENARRLNIAMIEGDYPKAKRLIADIEKDLK
jgi:hypothetical protein